MQQCRKRTGSKHTLRNGRGKRSVDSGDDDGGAELEPKRKKGNQGASG
jgi:hypothetical protein